MPSNKPKKRQLKKTETVRQRASKPVKTQKTQRLHTARSKVSKPFQKAWSFGRKEYYLPLPDNKLGRFLNKRRSLMPSYFVNSWRELRQVTWPNRKQTLQLTLAVFVFALFFGLLIAVVDFGLDKAFKTLILE